MGLERVEQVANRMQILPLGFPIITIAGTNGKGSSVALLDSILSAAGYKTAGYTSPHLHTYNERIKYCGTPIDDERLCEAFAFVESSRQSTDLTFFEYGTLAALYWFTLCKPDIAILETGLGGRLDAVNIVDADVSIITTIDIDHTEWLGEDRESIGREKAGIARKNRICVYGDTNPPQSITQLAQDGVLLQRIGEDFGYHPQGDSWSFYHHQETLDQLPLPALFGHVQLSNASCALAALRALSKQLPVEAHAIRDGLSNVRLDGRFQTETHRSRNGDFLAIFDIAHNLQGVETMVSNLNYLPEHGELHAIFSVFRTKDVRSMLQATSQIVDYWYISQNSSSQALPLDQLHALVQEYADSQRIFVADNIQQAYQAAYAKLAKNDKLLAFGSVVTVSEALDASRLSYNGDYRIT